jgi:hypothetical protein
MVPIIQLTLRIEHEAEAQRRLSMPYRDDFVNEKPVRPSRRNHWIERFFNLFRRPQYCECV